jgi:cation diffusion facilitator family transporter
LSVLKFVAGIFGRSQAVVADAVHSLSDSSTDVAILVGVRYWSQPPDLGHPHGHRRIETVITTVIGVVLAGVAVGLIYNALTTLHERDAAPPGWIAFAAALVSIFSKEMLYRWTFVVGKRIKSSAVVANAWHHRSDAFSSIPAALAVAGAAVSRSWSFLDHVGAVVVSLFIFQAAWRIAWPALGQLVDAGASWKDLERIRTIALGTEGVGTVHAIRTRHIGSGFQVDLHILVDGRMTVREGHDISEAVKQNLLADGPEVVDVVVHLEPHEEARNG